MEKISILDQDLSQGLSTYDILISETKTPSVKKSKNFKLVAEKAKNKLESCVKKKLEFQDETQIMAHSFSVMSTESSHLERESKVLEDCMYIYNLRL